MNKENNLNRHIALVVATAIMLSNLLLPLQGVQAKSNEAQEQAARNQQAAARAAQEQAARNQQAAARGAQEQAMRAQQEQARRVQEQEFKAQQDEARKTQEQELKAQEQAHRVQEQALKVQEDQARRVQEQAVKAQQEAARQAQEQAARSQAEAANRAQQEESFKLQAAERKTANDSAKYGAEEMERKGGEHELAPPNLNRIGTTALTRPASPRPLQEEALPLQKAVSMPVLEENATPEQQEHAQAVIHNLQAHMFAVPGSQAPPNIRAIQKLSLNNYTNNYRAVVNGQPLYINRDNTLVYPVQAGQYPYWYQPEPNWIFSNGFVLGSVLQVGLDWLRWNWHPYYGPPPDGFICSRDYTPTPWVYTPAYGLWTQPGSFSYASTGPDYDYTGPISVEVLEPRQIHVTDPYTGWKQLRTINVVYLYDAYFYPEYERWGYMNRHGYFIWLNT
jgi:hypothetical protein